MESGHENKQLRIKYSVLTDQDIDIRAREAAF